MSVALNWLLPMASGGRARFQAAVGALAAGQTPAAIASALWAVGGVDVALAEAQALRRAYRTWRATSDTAPAGFRDISLSLFANDTLSFLADGVFACGLRHGLLINATSSRFDEAVAAAHQGTLSGEPLDFAAILAPGDQVGEPHGALRVLDSVARLSQALAAQRSARTIVITLPPRLDEPKNSSDLLISASPRAQRASFNAGLTGMCREGRAIVWDMESLAGRVGSAHWFDPRLQHHAKIPFSLNATMPAADDLASVIAAATSRNRRALVLDLDNTIWGGVIGDDGLNGIVVGQGSAAGEAFLAVQRAALDLRSRGIALAICSKNDDANAREPFQKHPDMLLREEHIAVFTANWQDKATNIRAIAEDLNLGLQSIAFLDDNPAERERVRQVLPEVAVIEAGDDPAQYAGRLLGSGYFEHLPLTSEDLARAADYQANAERSTLMARAENYDDYLLSLEMTMTWSPFDALGRARISQLINKSNQFNLTTRRYTEQDIERIELSSTHRGFQIRLKDRFADNGMISVLVVERKETTWLIDTWLMSCRVLKRGVEGAVLNTLVSLAREEGIQWLAGDYVPTAKNGMVATHYQDLGFDPAGEIAGHPSADDGRTATRWRLNVADYQTKPVPMKIDIPAT
jgi:FkbH-like protein